MSGTAAIVGGGVIGGGWAARFLLNGWDVRVVDRDPEAERKIGDVLANARRSLPHLSDFPMPTEGKLSFSGDIAEAVAGADWIQESVPERLELKHQVLAEIQAAAPDRAIIGSSTSGFTPTQLQAGAVDPGRILVTHPFNPVYLLPLVEVVTSNRNLADIVDRASGILAGIGMYPLSIDKEIEAHIADRLLEAIWRESLWLIEDDIATTEQIDDAIRYGFGLRFAQMGLFETYRIAGGEAGMEHFIAQFGPCLKAPWTKLMDVPDLSETLIAKIVAQSEAQSGARSIRELERLRDDNLVAMLKSLKDRDAAAGALLNDWDRTRLDVPAPIAEQGIAAPLSLHQAEVLPSWIDYNQHMTEHRYLQVFGETTDALLRLIGVDLDYVAAGRSYYTAETHIMHVGQARCCDILATTTQILAVDEKRLHLYHEIHAAEDDRLVASAEQMMLHVDAATGNVCPALPPVRQALDDILSAHADLPWPERAGRRVGERRTS